MRIDPNVEKPTRELLGHAPAGPAGPDLAVLTLRPYAPLARASGRTAAADRVGRDYSHGPGAGRSLPGAG